MKTQTNKMPIFGVGPIYVITCLGLTIIGLILSYYGYLKAGQIDQGEIYFNILGGLSILFGLNLWIRAVLIQKINAKVKENKLITDGVYAIVRNPVYSAFIFLFTGVLLMAHNYLLLILPLIYWATLTILMKNTEEKWLREKFGQEYIEYCKNVNRIIPWKRRK